MKLGVCYYPEHWPESEWQRDARLMADAGLSLVRVGEFSWSEMEPNPGEYRWSWLDRAIETLSSAGLELILCTPTAAPPAWLVQRYPDILPVDREGRRLRFGSRRHYCPNHPRFQEQSTRICSQLGERYGQHPAVVAWQLDNEFACYLPRCYCPVCEEKFREWLQDRYQNLDKLNQAWGTRFWSQTYQSWDQIQPPILTVAEPNPSQVLDYRRFFSECWVKYQGLQSAALRAAVRSGQKITHNLIASLTDIDYYQLARDLDFISWDSYPTGYQEMQIGLLPDDQAGSTTLGHPQLTDFFHSLVRGLHPAAFWVMEHQTGQINWSRFNASLPPGALRIWTWQAALNGAEAVVFFRWRASRFGLEQHHAGLLRHDGSLDTGYQDLLDLKNDLDQIRQLENQRQAGSIAILLDYEDLWALELQPHREGFSYLGQLYTWYQSLRQLGLEPDLVSSQSDFSSYRLVIAPVLHLGRPALAEALAEYVHGGGSLMLGVRSGFKTISNLVTDQPLPGVYRNLAGIQVQDWGSLPPAAAYALETALPLESLEASIWAEALIPDDDTEVLISYQAGPYQGQAAFTRHPVGDGVTYTLGWLPSGNQIREIMEWICRELDWILSSESPPGVAVFHRGDSSIALNFGEQPAGFTLKSKAREIPAREILVIADGRIVKSLKEQDQ